MGRGEAGAGACLTEPESESEHAVALGMLPTIRIGTQETLIQQSTSASN